MGTLSYFAIFTFFLNSKIISNKNLKKKSQRLSTGDQLTQFNPQMYEFWLKMFKANLNELPTIQIQRCNFTSRCMVPFRTSEVVALLPRKPHCTPPSSGPKAPVSQSRVCTLHGSAQAVRRFERVRNPKGTWVPAPHRAESRASFRALVLKNLGILRLRSPGARIHQGFCSHSPQLGELHSII